MTKQTRSEYERDGLPMVTQGIEVVATLEVEIRATTALSSLCPLTRLPEESQNTVGIPESQVPARVVTADVEVGEGSGNEMAHANKAVVGDWTPAPYGFC